MRNVLLIITFFSFCFFASVVQAEEGVLSTDLLNAQVKEEINFSFQGEVVSEVPKFIAGWLMGFAAHEYGHQATADGHHVRMQWNSNLGELPTKGWTAVTYNKSHLKDIALGGFMAQAMSSELLLSQKERGSFITGWLAFNIANALVYSFGSSDQGDWKMYKENGGDEKIAKALVISHAVWSAYRLATNADPFFTVIPRDDGIILTAKVASW